MIPAAGIKLPASVKFRVPRVVRWDVEPARLAAGKHYHCNGGAVARHTRWRAFAFRLRNGT
jgi:hypothetical protein